MSKKKTKGPKTGAAAGPTEGGEGGGAVASGAGDGAATEGSSTR